MRARSFIVRSCTRSFARPTHLSKGSDERRVTLPLLDGRRLQTAAVIPGNAWSGLSHESSDNGCTWSGKGVCVGVGGGGSVGWW